MWQEDPQHFGKNGGGRGAPDKVDMVDMVDMQAVCSWDSSVETGSKVGRHAGLAFCSWHKCGERVDRVDMRAVCSLAQVWRRGCSKPKHVTLNQRLT
jgi:hypothetical protein